MKIGILSRNSELYSTRRLKEAAEQRGHEVEIIDYLSCYMNINSEKTSVHIDGADLPHLDAIIPRIGANRTFYGCAVVRQLELMGIFSLNTSLAITRSRDKLRSLQLMARKKIGMPITGFAHSPDDIDDLITLVGGVPVVIKLIEGTQGIGVVLAETKKAAQSVIQAFMGLKANIIVQEYIKESNGSDIRCLVVGGKVVASIKREADPGDFRSNLHRGGSAVPVKITKQERALAIKAAKVMGLNLAGVDILRSDRGPLIMEVNSSPGLEGIESVTEIDVAAEIIKHLEKILPSGPRKRYHG
ncbi:MAG: 30S ribosomal protein S6--L-glutamate ligase [Chlamydiales bacterium]|nr:30S ribosomal protein S6--L-glutamate ligase [Chlamydiia bacterium]MCP5504208.1 30S ribosomal protein S6--L-glutamate ligase [Chlamydiales bacterium]